MADTVKRNTSNSKILYTLKKGSFGFSSQKIDKRQTQKKLKLTLYYELADRKALDNTVEQHVVFQSKEASPTNNSWVFINEELKNFKKKPEKEVKVVFNVLADSNAVVNTGEQNDIVLSEDESSLNNNWIFIDEALAHLKIKPEEEVSLVFRVTLDSKPNLPFLTSILSIEAQIFIGCSTFYMGIIVLSTALMYPLIVGLAIIGAVLLGIGLALMLTYGGANLILYNTPIETYSEVTVEQKGAPESKQSLTGDTKKVFLSRFFFNETNKNSIKDEEIKNSSESKETPRDAILI